MRWDDTDRAAGPRRMGLTGILLGLVCLLGLPERAARADNVLASGQTNGAPENPGEELPEDPCSEDPPKTPQAGPPIYLDTGEFALLPYEHVTPIR